MNVFFFIKEKGNNEKTLVLPPECEKRKYVLDLVNLFHLMKDLCIVQIVRPKSTYAISKRIVYEKMQAIIPFHAIHVIVVYW